MKKLSIAVALFAISTFAQATGVCTGTAGPAAAAVTLVDGDFIKSAFIPRCSGNVHMDYEEDVQAVGVGAASAKGSSVFQGNSEFGAVRGVECTGRRCTGTEAAAAATAALAEAASS